VRGRVRLSFLLVSVARQSDGAPARTERRSGHFYLPADDRPGGHRRSLVNMYKKELAGGVDRDLCVGSALPDTARSGQTGPCAAEGEGPFPQSETCFVHLAPGSPRRRSATGLHLVPLRHRARIAASPRASPCSRVPDVAVVMSLKTVLAAEAGHGLSVVEEAACRSRPRHRGRAQGTKGGVREGRMGKVDTWGRKGRVCKIGGGV